MSVDRRHLIKGAAAGASAAAFGVSPLTFATLANAQPFGESVPFSRDKMIVAARALSTKPFVDRRDEIPEALRTMSYQAYSAMRPGPDWPIPLSSDDRFFFDALLAGFVFNQPVDLWLVTGDQAQRVVFDRSTYIFDPPADTEAPEGNIPFSGFRLRAPINSPDKLDEFAVFQGASYFRAVGAGENYGLSARGLAIDTGQPTGEEFPVFRSFWIERPQEGAKAVVVNAILDSPSTTGAYRITVRPGDATVTDVELTLFPRRDIKTIGFAPFSSMFLFSGVNRSNFDDYRNAVHDSDGLSIYTGNGEWLWRPLSNPSRLQVSAFVDTTPRGFGLIQRKRDYDDYEDAAARFETRPSAWVEPIGDWQSGAVVLFEIPSGQEFNDNVVAYWQPNAPIKAGEPYEITYRIHWNADAPATPDGPRVSNTRIGRNQFATRELFVIDYAMKGHSIEDVEVNVETSAGKIVNLTHFPTPEPDTLRITFELDSDAETLAELRLQLTLADGQPAEQWLYRWTT
ncbi:glucan biosynthesis protein [Acuticoccus sp. M5D2P5]|uniref:glucan biosynthesis protein n=1 Tax=Acuticoccus kalidii TaxID=2910977 RepID=UPI001F3D8FF1|nr:glucan biosynthesis protein G [Acuticoccus kalidii]MCF3934285.1 glucan biosynthesis protein [Acuticoccus kalidii]